MKLIFLTIGLFFLSTIGGTSQDTTVKYFDQNDHLKVLIVKDPYSDSRTGPEKLKGPENLDNKGLSDLLELMDCHLIESKFIKMPEELSRQYGEWNRASLTNNVLNKTIAQYEKDELFVLGLLSGNKSLIGMLGGLQHVGPNRQPLKDSRNRDIVGLPRLGDSKPLKVGLVWISASAAFNTPDITLEGDMGGMNMAVAAGLCNNGLRIQAGLDPPISTKHIVMVGGWKTNPYEEHEIDNSFIRRISVGQVSKNSKPLVEEMERLSMDVDLIYVHVDLSILRNTLLGSPDPGADYFAIDKLMESIENVFRFPKAAALGIASCPEEPEDEVLTNANLIIKGALTGIRNR